MKRIIITIIGCALLLVTLRAQNTNITITWPKNPPSDNIVDYRVTLDTTTTYIPTSSCGTATCSTVFTIQANGQSHIVTIAPRNLKFIADPTSLQEGLPSSKNFFAPNANTPSTPPVSVGNSNIAITFGGGGGGGGGGDQPLNIATLTFVGAFRLPDNSCYDGSGMYLAWNSTNNDLWALTSCPPGGAQELSIPTIVNSYTLSALNRSTLIQPSGDIFNGNANDPGIVGPSCSGGAVGGGILGYLNKVYATAFCNYDAINTQTKSHFSHLSTLSNNSGAVGPVQVGAIPAGFVAGPMTLTAPNWVVDLGGPAITFGSNRFGAITRSSLGPAAFSFDPSQIGVNTPPIAANSLLYYPNTHQTIGGEGSGPNAYEQLNDIISGTVMPPGYRSLIYFGRHGMGPNCYGPGVNQNPPNPPVDTTVDISSGSNASTSSDGLTVTLPNATVGNGVIWLSSQTIPNIDAGNSFDNSITNAGHPGVSTVTSFGNSGAANAFVTVSNAFTGNLTSQNYHLSVDRVCYDPEESSKGQHSYGKYRYYAWAYDLADLRSVKNGTLQPWQPIPYAVRDISSLMFPTTTIPATVILGAAIDSANRHIFIPQAQVDGNRPAFVVLGY